jgi:hypothetical protein
VAHLESNVTKNQSQEVVTVSQLGKAFDHDTKMIRKGHVPFFERSKDQQQRVTKCLSIVLERSCKLFCPSSWTAIRKAVVDRHRMDPDDALLVDAVVRICRELPKRGLQRRVLMAALSEAYSGIQVQHLLGCGKNQFTSSVKDASFLLAGFELQKGEQSLQRYARTWCSAVSNSSSRTRVWRPGGRRSTP